MEEKERYEIHIYDDICVDLYDNGVLDKSINDTYKLEELLNQQSKRIKELEQENQQLKQQLAITEKALELAVNYMQSYCPYLTTKKKDGNVIFYIDKTDCDNNCSNCIKTHYKQRAKEMLENE